MRLPIVGSRSGDRKRGLWAILSRALPIPFLPSSPSFRLPPGLGAIESVESDGRA